MEKQLLEDTCLKLRRLLDLAEELKRSNLAKLSFARQEWQAALAAFETNHDPSRSAHDEIGNIVRAAGNVVRRLGNSGEARFKSYEAGREPDSSSDGKRFRSDLEKAQRILEDLLSLNDGAAGSDGSLRADCSPR